MAVASKAPLQNLITTEVMITKNHHSRRPIHHGRGVGRRGEPGDMAAKTKQIEVRSELIAPDARSCWASCERAWIETMGIASHAVKMEMKPHGR